MKASSGFNARPARPLWGIRPPANKDQSLAQPVRVMPPPARVVIPVDQCLGLAGEPLVTIGQPVVVGQPIAAAAAAAAIAGPQVHASIGGIVTGVERRPVAGRATTEPLCIVIDSDARNEDPGIADFAVTGGDPLQMTSADLCAQIAAAGIVGLGGALYSTAAKLGGDRPIDTLIINGAECEPYITCDEILIRTRAIHVLHGARIMQHALGATRTVFAVESDMPEARAALSDAIEADGDNDMHICVVTAKYPAGGERQLTELVMGREVPEHGWPTDIGIVCHNVGTAGAVADLFDHGRPLISRVVTVTGHGIADAGNFDVRIGTSIRDLLAFAGRRDEPVGRIVMGGPMMGRAVPDDSLPVTKATNCLIVMRPEDITPEAPEMPCIRCGECVVVCPARLLPQELLIAARRHDMDGLQTLGISACIECGCCDYVCPSQIRLTDRLTEAKVAQAQHVAGLRRAERARERSEARAARLAGQRHAAAANLDRQLDDTGDAGAIDAIMARVRNKESGATDSQTAESRPAEPAPEPSTDERSTDEPTGK